jgi:uncharacterized protein YbjQ (UPF0145 family)
MARPEGWYPDYGAPGGGWVRFWDGERWTDKVRADRQVTAEDVVRLTGIPAEGQAPEPDPADGVLITTGLDFPGQQVVAHVGEVFGLTVRARNAFSDAAAAVRNLVGGEAAGYTKMLSDARHEALGRLRRDAARRNANAVIAMRMEANAITDGMTELIAYGTAVVIEPVAPQQATASLGQATSANGPS